MNTRNRKFVDRPLTLKRAIEVLRKPGTRLLLQHSRTGPAYYIAPGHRADRRDWSGGRVSEQIARALLEHSDVQPFDSGLLPGHPQSWRLGNWRSPG